MTRAQITVDLEFPRAMREYVDRFLEAIKGEIEDTITDELEGRGLTAIAAVSTYKEEA